MIACSAVAAWSGSEKSTLFIIPGLSSPIKPMLLEFFSTQEMFHTNKFRHIHIVKGSLWVKLAIDHFIGFWISLYPPRNMWISSSPIRRSQKATWQQIEDKNEYISTKNDILKALTSSKIPPAKPLCPVPSPSSALVSWQPSIIVGGLSPFGSCNTNTKWSRSLTVDGFWENAADLGLTIVGGRANNLVCWAACWAPTCVSSWWSCWWCVCLCHHHHHHCWHKN